MRVKELWNQFSPPNSLFSSEALTIDRSKQCRLRRLSTAIEAGCLQSWNIVIERLSKKSISAPILLAVLFTLLFLAVDFDLRLAGQAYLWQAWLAGFVLQMKWECSSRGIGNQGVAGCYSSGSLTLTSSVWIAGMLCLNFRRTGPYSNNEPYNIQFLKRMEKQLPSNNTTASSPPLAMPPSVRVEYFPFQRTVVEYREEEYVERVPREEVTYQRRKVKKLVPREREVIDYIRIDKIVSYKLAYESQVVETPPAPEYQFMPVQKVIVSYPNDARRRATSLDMAREPSLPTPISTIANKLTQPISSVEKKDLVRAIVAPTPKVSKPFIQQIFSFQGKLRDTLVFQNINSRKAIEYDSQLAVCQCKTTGEQKQRWRLQKYKNAYYIVSINNGLCMDFGRFEEKEPVVLKEPAGKESQLFQLQSTAEGTGYIRCKYDNNFCLGLLNGSRAEEAPLRVLRVVPDSKPQQFRVHGLSLLAQ